MVGGKAAVDDYGFEIAPHHQRQQCRYPQKVHVAQHAQDTLPLPPPNLGDICGLEEDCPPMPEAIYAAPGDAASADMDTMGKIPRMMTDFHDAFTKNDLNNSVWSVVSVLIYLWVH